MRLILTSLALIAGFTSQATLASHSSRLDNPMYTDPYDEPAHGLRFADLEFEMPTDPLLWSSDPGWEAHHTPARFLASATDALSAAVPPGTAASEAAAVLSKAGARCAVAATAVECRYRDTESPQGGDYNDAITWRVSLPVTDGQVGALSVTRDWTRR